jgi:hypothetical protein
MESLNKYTVTFTENRMDFLIQETRGMEELPFSLIFVIEMLIESYNSVEITFPNDYYIPFYSKILKSIIKDYKHNTMDIPVLRRKMKHYLGQSFDVYFQFYENSNIIEDDPFEF